jgi:hypothetical protein
MERNSPLELRDSSTTFDNSSGDFNYDGMVNGSDYTLIDNAFNQQSASLPAVTESQAAHPSFAAAFTSQITPGQQNVLQSQLNDLKHRKKLMT